MVGVYFSNCQALDKPSYTSLVEYCSTQLEGIFEQTSALRVIHANFVPHQPLHLDILCAWPQATTKSFSGAGPGKPLSVFLHPKVDTCTTGLTPGLPIVEVTTVGKTISKPSHTLAQDIARRFKRCEIWVSNYKTPTIHLKIPREILHQSADVDMRTHWQVNLLIIPPPTLPFHLGVQSYGSVPHILGSIVKWVSPSLTLHRDRLILIHHPHPQQNRVPPIVLELTSDVGAFFRWLGIGERPKSRSGWENERFVWSWLVDYVQNDTHMDAACCRMTAYHIWEEENPSEARVMAEKRKKLRKEEKGKGGEYAEDSMKNSKQETEGGSWVELKEKEKEKKLYAEQRERFFDHLISFGRIGNPYIPDFNFDSIIEARRLANQGPIDPDHPQVISTALEKIITHFGKEDEWNRLVEENTALAWQLAGKKARARRARKALAMASSGV